MEFIVNYFVISSLARMHCEDLLRDAARRRALRARPATHAFRMHVARAVRRVGRATIVFGDALAGTR
ncbi:MAG: hypothetical protein IAI50_17270 [Candidatus Eremiobacteraeota bacterium]|nr:hypothetical protein [Candidatus Eremiobacteraeota bacterium]